MAGCTAFGRRKRRQRAADRLGTFEQQRAAPVQSIWRANRAQFDTKRPLFEAGVAELRSQYSTFICVPRRLMNTNSSPDSGSAADGERVQAIEGFAHVDRRP